MKIKIALIQMDTVLGGIKENTERHLEWIEQARAANADLVIFPELSLTGYYLQDMALEVAVRPGKNECFTEIQAASQDLDVMFGFVEVDERSQFFISAAYLSQGEVAHIHRKIYLPTYTIFDDKRYFSSGGKVRAFDTRFGRVGMLICEDFWHVSTPYLLWLDGADLFLCQAASPGHGLSSADRLDSERQIETILSTYAGLFTSFLAYTNRVGYEDGLHFPGGGIVLDPGGEVLARAGTNAGMTCVEVDLNQTRRQRFRLPLLSDERPELVLRELKRIVKTDW
jgi:NAD+ synthase (glutamine-hydrolysing)